MADLGGVRVGIAFNNAPLDAYPAYTYITSLAGVSVQKITTHRGRADERSKVDVGGATVTGRDTGGVLDPTNTGGSYYGKLDPIKQAIIEVQNAVTGDWNPIFQGYVGDWTFDVHPSEKLIDWTLELVDALDILGAAEVVPDSAGNTVPQESTGDCYYIGQPVKDRILAAIYDTASTLFGVAWPASRLNIFSGNVYVQGTPYPARTTLLQVIQDAGDAEFPGVGIFFVAADGTLTFHGRYARFQPTYYTEHGIQIWTVGDAAAFAADSSTAVIAALEYTRGKANLINAALSYPVGIAQADIAGQLADDAASISDYGPRSISFENLITEAGEADGLDAKQETKEYGQYYVDNFKTPRNRVAKVSWRSQDPTESRAGPIWKILAGDASNHPLDLSDLCYLTTTHPGGGGFANEGFFIESCAYTITPANDTFSNVRLDCDVSPKAYYDTDFHT